MPFDHGSIALTICPLSSPLPEDYLEKLESAAAGKLEDGSGNRLGQRTFSA